MSSAAAHAPEIGVVINSAMRAIERENKRRKDILLKSFAHTKLTELFQQFNEVDEEN